MANAKQRRASQRFWEKYTGPTKEGHDASWRWDFDGLALMDNDQVWAHGRITGPFNKTGLHRFRTDFYTVRQSRWHRTVKEAKEWIEDQVTATLLKRVQFEMEYFTR